MGTYSWYLTTRNNAAGCKINWTTVNTDILFKNHYLKSFYNKYDNMQELAEQLDEKKFIGYLTQDFIFALKELSKNLIPYGSFPRIYYEYEGDDKAYCMEFFPGTEHFNLHVCDSETNKTDNESLKLLKERLLLSPESKGWRSQEI